jgi:hypothetical protein
MAVVTLFKARYNFGRFKNMIFYNNIQDTGVCVCMSDCLLWHVLLYVYKIRGSGNYPVLRL